MLRLCLASGLMLVFGLACGPAPPPPGEAPSAPPQAAGGLSAQRDSSTLLPPRPEASAGGTTAGADPLEGEPANPAASSGPGDGSAPEGAPAASSLPSWLRAVREVRARSIIGTGGVGPKRVGLQVGHWRNEDVPDELRQLRASGGGATGG